MLILQVGMFIDRLHPASFPCATSICEELFQIFQCVQPKENSKATISPHAPRQGPTGFLDLAL